MSISTIAQDAALQETTAQERVERNIVSLDVEEPVSEREVVMGIPSQLVTVSCYYKGTIFFTRTSIIFEASEIADPLSEENEKAQKIVIVQVKTNREWHWC